MDETTLVAECMEVLRAALPAGTEPELRPARPPAGEASAAGRLRIRGPRGDLEIPVQARRRITDGAVALMNRRFRDGGLARHADAPAWVLFTEYVNGRQARRYREDGIAFADTRGTVHLWGPGLFVWVVGNRPKARRTKVHRLTRPAAAQVLFVLLQDPDRAREPYRDVAALAGVAPDTVHRVFKDLEDKGFLRVLGSRDRELTRVAELHEVWIMAYEDALRPRLQPRRFHWTAGRPLNELADALLADPTLPLTLLGGETAAAALTDAIRPTTATLHTSPSEQRAAMKALELVPRSDGAITLLDTFGTANEWQVEGHGTTHLADPLLVHAELLQIADDRARAVAEAVYDEYVMRRFAGDQ